MPHIDYILINRENSIFKIHGLFLLTSYFKCYLPSSGFSFGFNKTMALAVINQTRYKAL